MKKLALSLSLILLMPGFLVAGYANDEDSIGTGRRREASSRRVSKRTGQRRARTKRSKRHERATRVEDMDNYEEMMDPMMSEHTGNPTPTQRARARSGMAGRYRAGNQ